MTSSGDIAIFAGRRRPVLMDSGIPASMTIFVSIGAGETHVTEVLPDGRPRQSWTAVFGWSTLRDVPILLDGMRVMIDGDRDLEAALMGRLTLKGSEVDTTAFMGQVRKRLRDGVGRILDATVGAGCLGGRIVLAAPPWLHDALSDCLDLRPEIQPRIEEL